MDDSELLAQANDTIQQQRRAHHPSAAFSDPKPIGATIGRLLAKIDAAPAVDAAFEAEELSRRRREEQQARTEAWGKLQQRIGRRYADCTLEMYQAESDPQQSALDRVRAYCENMADNLTKGVGALFYGPPGTGKDHLAVAIMRAAVLHYGVKAEWTDGAEFYGQIRDNIDADKSESEFIKRFTRPDLLVMSDPLPPSGRVDSSFQLSMVFRVIDRRYRDQKATVVTLNVADRKEAEQRLSPNIVDRLAHGALAIHCNWESYRKRQP